MPSAFGSLSAVRLGARPPGRTLVVGVAEMLACNDLNAELVTYSLGSCLGITVYDPVKKVGGLLHVMLPTGAIDPARARALPYMFVDSGVPRLIHAVHGLGGEKRRLIVKVAGGAQFLYEQRIFNIGERNVQALRAFLECAGLAVDALDVGGRSSRTLRFSLATGDVSIHSPGDKPYFL